MHEGLHERAARGVRTSDAQGDRMSWILLLIILVLLIGALPSWGYSRDWGYGPSGGLALVLVVVLVLTRTITF